MPTNCLACGTRRKVDSSWYTCDKLNDPLEFLNELRQQVNESKHTLKHQLSPLTVAPVKGKSIICQECYNAGLRNLTDVTTIGSTSTDVHDDDAEENSENGKDGSFKCGQSRRRRRSTSGKETRSSKRLASRSEEPNYQESEDDGDDDYDTDYDDDGEELNEDFLRRSHTSHRRCIFDCEEPSERLVRVNRKIRRLLLVDYSLYLPSDSCRMCFEHLATEDWWPLVRRIEQPVGHDECMTVIRLLQVYANDSHDQSSGISIQLNNVSSIPDDDYFAMFGFSKRQVGEICQLTGCDAKYVAIFLAKVRSGASNAMLGAIFGLSESTIGRYVSSAIEAINDPLVDAYLTPDREMVLSHNTPIASLLLNSDDNKAMIVFDASYRYVGKSSNFSAQRDLHCAYKTRNLYKPMVGCATDGYIFFVMGPRKARYNDAKILKKCFDQNQGNLNFALEAGDIMVLDRGFRDVVQFLETKGFQVKISRGAASSQVGTLEANNNRLITKCRWIIEQVFGRLKMKFKFLEKMAHNGSLEHDFDIWRICCSLLNMFHIRIISDANYATIAEEMLERVDRRNLLQNVVQELRLERARVPFRQLNNVADIIARFPQLSNEDIHMIAFGSYQMRMARSYLGEHFTSNGGTFHIAQYNGEIDFARFGIVVERPMLLKTQIQSRFISSKKHYTFVLIDMAKVGREAILEYYCSCATGSRTVGSCSHIITIIYYLSNAHAHPLSFPNPMLTNFAN